MRRSLIAAPVALVLFAAGYLAGQQSTPAPVTAAPAAQFGAEWCRYETRTEYLPGIGNGSYTVLTAVIAEWSILSRRWSSVSDYVARQSVTSYNCERGL